MSGRQLRTLSMVLTLAAVLGFAGAPPGAAAVRNRVPAGQAAGGALERAWDWLAGWIGGHGQSLTRLWAEAGMGADPDGAHSTAPFGPGLDPNGGRASVSGDAGYGLDPDGGRASVGGRVSVQGDMGPGLDPDGSH